MTPFVALFMVTLVPAVLAGMMRGGDALVVATVLLASFLGAHLSWDSGHPIMANAMSDLLCATLIVALCSERWAMAVAILFLLAVACSVIAELRVVYGYAHILSILGHAQNIGTLIGGKNGGHRSRTDREIWRIGAYN